VLLPGNPLRLALGGAGPVIDSLADALDHISAAAARRDAGEADRAVAEVARLRPHHDALEDTLAEAAATARTSLGRREALDRIALLTELARHLRLAVADARSLARGVGRAIDLDDATPPELDAAIQALAESARAMRALVDGGDPEPAREAAVRAAGLANTVLAQTSNLSALHCVGQVRLLAVDLLRASGVEREHAQEAVRSARPHALRA
jgi:hypothetical protein